MPDYDRFIVLHMMGHDYKDERGLYGLLLETACCVVSNAHLYLEIKKFLFPVSLGVEEI